MKKQFTFSTGLLHDEPLEYCFQFICEPINHRGLNPSTSPLFNDQKSDCLKQSFFYSNILNRMIQLRSFFNNNTDLLSIISRYKSIKSHFNRNTTGFHRFNQSLSLQKWNFNWLKEGISLQKWNYLLLKEGISLQKWNFNWLKKGISLLKRPLYCTNRHIFVLKRNFNRNFRSISFQK